MLVKQGIQRSQSDGLLDILTLCHHGRRPEQFTGTYLQFPRFRDVFCPLLYFLFCVLTSVAPTLYLIHHLPLSYLGCTGGALRPPDAAHSRAKFSNSLPDKHNLSCDSKPPVFPQHHNHGNNGC
jgi:hypothetical protein